MSEPIEAPTSITEQESGATEVFNSIKISLAELCAKGTAQYAHRNYAEAADLYAQASELQAELNGEMSTDNAEILFLYGRSLFKLGQSKSDVLGGRAGAEKKLPKSSAKPAKPKVILEESPDVGRKISEQVVPVVMALKNAATKPEETIEAKKPLFQFAGDENFEDSDEDKGEGEEEEDEDEEEDDLEAAFSVLDLTRILFEKKLAGPENVEGKGKIVGDSATAKHYKERLADTHDLLAEISLENERFPAAVADSRASLTYKKELFGEESSAIAEAHFKLSLALEFASITSTADDNIEGATDTIPMDETMRDEAVFHLEAAIRSTSLKLQNKEAELAISNSPDDNDTIRSQITEVKEMLAELKSRLVDLKGPAVDVKSAIYGPLADASGILNSTDAESPSDAAARIEKAKQSATDVSGLVRKKAKVMEVTAEKAGSEKRKLGDDCEKSDGKRARVDATEDKTDD